MSDDSPRTETAPQLGNVSEVEFEALRRSGQQLILAAFSAARRSGRSDWDRMTMAVLKNRILDQTDRRFDQELWGAATFRDFVEQFPEVVKLDRNVKPPMVELLPSSGSTSEGELPATQVLAVPRRRVSWLIRSDLWQAVLDYSSGDRFVWEDGAVVRISAAQREPGDLRPILPTVSAEEMRLWRSEFAEAVTADTTQPELLSVVNRWRDESLTSTALPTRVRWRWIETLKGLVRDRLQQWFEATAIQPPPDLIEMPETARSAGDDTEQLRHLVIRCVRAMSRAELEEVRLPPAVVLRIKT